MVAVDFAVLIGLGEVGAGLGFGEACVVEGAAVGSPGDLGRLGPPQGVREVFAGDDVANLPDGPVRAGLRGGIGDEGAGAIGIEAIDRDGAVGGHGVGVDENVLLALDAILI